MSAQHTPGPWRAEHNWNGRILVDAGPPGVRAYRIATLDKEHPGAGVGGVLQQTANAALIAAAPELLAQLKAAVVWMENACDYCGSEFGTADENEEIVAARAAIAKAEGTAS